MAERKCRESEPGAFVALPGGAYLVRWDRPGVQEWSWMFPPVARRFVGAYLTREACEAALAQAMKPRERAA